VCEATLALGIGAYLLARRPARKHAAKSRSGLSIQDAHESDLEYGQPMPAHTGRGTGIIDTVADPSRRASWLLEATGLDRASPAACAAGSRDYLKWMMTSTKGLVGNNHATCGPRKRRLRDHSPATPRAQDVLGAFPHGAHQNRSSPTERPPREARNAIVSYSR